jgi:hypothetical protein
LVLDLGLFGLTFLDFKSYLKAKSKNKLIDNCCNF